MINVIEFFTSTYFFGILLMSGAVTFFLPVFAMGWFKCSPRRFFKTCLSYETKEDQQFARFMWMIAWCLSMIGSLLVACNHPNIPHEFLPILVAMICSIIQIWVIAKVVFALFILVAKVKDWILNDKPLLSC